MGTILLNETTMDKKGVQSIIFKKTMFTKLQAKKWLIKHDFKTSVDEKPETYRFRQMEPVEGANYITKKIEPGISFVIRV